MFPEQTGWRLTGRLLAWLGNNSWLSVDVASGQAGQRGVLGESDTHQTAKHETKYTKIQNTHPVGMENEQGQAREAGGVVDKGDLIPSFPVREK